MSSSSTSSASQEQDGAAPAVSEPPFLFQEGTFSEIQNRQLYVLFAGGSENVKGSCQNEINNHNSTTYWSEFINKSLDAYEKAPRASTGGISNRIPEFGSKKYFAYGAIRQACFLKCIDSGTSGKFQELTWKRMDIGNNQEELKEVLKKTEQRFVSQLKKKRGKKRKRDTNDQEVVAANPPSFNNTAAALGATASGVDVNQQQFEQMVQACGGNVQYMVQACGGNNMLHALLLQIMGEIQSSNQQQLGAMSLLRQELMQRDAEIASLRQQVLTLETQVSEITEGKSMLEQFTEQGQPQASVEAATTNPTQDVFQSFVAPPPTNAEGEPYHNSLVAL